MSRSPEALRGLADIMEALAGGMANSIAEYARAAHPDTGEIRIDDGNALPSVLMWLMASDTAAAARAEIREQAIGGIGDRLAQVEEALRNIEGQLLQQRQPASKTFELPLAIGEGGPTPLGNRYRRVNSNDVQRLYDLARKAGEGWRSGTLSGEAMDELIGYITELEGK